jgi:hydroxymethylbilane synthase
MLPAPGQGAVAVTARSDDAAARSAAHAAWHHQPTALCVVAERALLRGLDGGCQVPVAAHATLQSGRLELTARVIGLQGDNQVAGIDGGAADSIEAAQTIGTRLARRLIAEGADQILVQIRAAASGA